MASEIALALYWHQHQPYYPDDVAGENPMPWVRLHGVKDYYGMALHLLEVPEMRCTINLVPSLVKQLQGYTEHGATDAFLKVSHLPTDGLTEANALFLLDHFFMANAEQMIHPYPRYHELQQRRAADRSPAKEALRRFNRQDLRDLQVWFNLTWIHPLAFERDAELKSLLIKGKLFSEQDKQLVLSKHLDILKQVLPLHRELQERGQVELTTTPYFHPILPLLFDKKLAREAMPDVKLPRYTQGYLDDAAVHVRRAVEQHTQVFGRAPVGMWPAEGSVCQAMLPLLYEQGIRWIATDEEVLNGSLHGQVSRDARGLVRHPEKLYRPYQVQEGEAKLGMVFRDHALSDLIGFHYQRSEAEGAVHDFLGKLRSIRQAIPSREPAIVSVILDGENCWEYYPGGGVAFLRTLYERIAQASDIKPVQIGAYLEAHPPRDTLPHLFAGSWINHNFAIWIGHEEDNTAWDALHRAREYLIAASPKFQSTPEGRTRLARAWEELYIAQGSDWFWWYGDDHSSAQDLLFDHLFRKHLQNIYALLGDSPPTQLSHAIKKVGTKTAHTQPRSFLDPKIDGRRTFFEWLEAGQYLCQNERGTMAMSGVGLLKELYFGFTKTALAVRVDLQQKAKSLLENVDTLRLGFSEPAGYALLIHEPGRAEQTIELWQHDNPLPCEGVEVGIDLIVELLLPLSLLGLEPGRPLYFFVELLEQRQGRDRAPREGTIRLNCPSPDFEQSMWGV